MLNMISQKIMKSSIMVMTAAMLIAAALAVNPANVVHAQGNATQALANATQALGNATQALGNATQALGNATQEQGNLTVVIDVDTLSKNIKERHPILAQMGADEDKVLIVGVKDMDPKEAVKTVIALNMLRLLQQYKEVDAK
jgi:hypothetical protein